MAAEEHKQLIRRFVEEVWNEGDIESAERFFARDFVDHNPPRPGVARGVEGAKEVFAMYRSAFPDLELTIQDMLVEGDRVAWRWTSRGTHQGALGAIPPTGRETVVSGIEIYRIAGGKIAERWGSFDQHGLMVQLGVVPTHSPDRSD